MAVPTKEQLTDAAARLGPGFSKGAFAAAAAVADTTAQEVYRMGLAGKALLDGDKQAATAVDNRLLSVETGRPRDENNRDSEKQKNRRLYEQLQFQQQALENQRQLEAYIDRMNDMADWYHDHARIAAEQMEKIAQRMGERSEFIDAAEEIFDEERKTGRFDREKALKALKGRGIDADKNISNEDLRILLKQQQTNDKNANALDSSLYEAQKIQQESYLKSEEEIRQAALEYNKEKQEILKNYTGDELAEKLKELEEKAGQDVMRRAAQLETDKKIQEEHNLQVEKTGAVRTSNETNDLFDDDDVGLTAKYNAAANPISNITPVNDMASVENNPIVQKNFNPGIGVS